MNPHPPARAPIKPRAIWTVRVELAAWPVRCCCDRRSSLRLVPAQPPCLHQVAQEQAKAGKEDSEALRKFVFVSVSHDKGNPQRCAESLGAQWQGIALP